MVKKVGRCEREGERRCWSEEERESGAESVLREEKGQSGGMR
jgi:hypothetical protein